MINLRIAQVTVDASGSTFGLGSAGLKQTAINTVNWVLGLLVLAALVMIIVGWVDLLISGDSEVVKIRARRIITSALIGLVIVLLSWAIVTFVFQATTNVAR